MQVTRSHTLHKNRCEQSAVGDWESDSCESVNQTGLHHGIAHEIYHASEVSLVSTNWGTSRHKDARTSIIAMT